ncbi:MAG: hypothetical protein D6748_00180 [Calditrichaeota bacterium]|nr:MAG: hypothetical protein D6748_00180 [Calditrichota bacterium]
MRRIIWFTFLIPFFFILLSAMQTSKEPIGKITFPLNRVFVIPAGTSELKYAQFNMEVYPGDKIETKKESRCEITLRNGDVFRIDENSIFTLEEALVTEKTVKAEMSLSLGKIWANIKKIFSRDDYLRVKSPSAVIAVRGTIYRVDAQEDSTTEVRVYEGEVAVTPPPPKVPTPGAPPRPQPKPKPQEVPPPTQVPAPTQVQGPTEVSVEVWVEIVKAQQQIVIKPDGTRSIAEFDPEQDAQLDWVRWNKRRDSLLNR